MKAVDGVSFTLAPHETLAIVGEFGCGKSITALSLMRLVPGPPGRVAGGKVELAGVDLLALDEEAMRAVRGKDIAMIFQEPMTSLNPVLTIGNQIAEAVLLHEKDKQQAGLAEGGRHAAARAHLGAEQRAHEYPHQLSGGMRQRVMIAMALACNPKVLIADEPTTALDVTIQAQILEIILDLQRKLGTAVILITHDLGVVAETAQRVIVMYAGRKVEEASVEELFARPQHPYTHGLMGSIPRLPSMRGENAGAVERLQEIPGHRAGAHQSAARLRVRAALRARRGPLPRAISRRTRKSRRGHWAACWRSHELYGDRQCLTNAPCSKCCDLKKHFPIRKGFLQRAGGTVFAVDGVSFTSTGGRDAWPGRRIRLRQINGRAHGAAADRADRRQHPAFPARTSRTLSKTELRPYRRADADHFPGSVLRRSIRACRPATSWPNRCACMASPAASSAGDGRDVVRARGPAPRRRWTVIRTSSPAASGSASASRARSRCSRS